MSDAFTRLGHSVILFGRMPDNAAERLNNTAIRKYYGTKADFDIRLVHCRLKARFWSGLEYGFKTFLSVLKLQNMSFKKLQTSRNSFWGQQGVSFKKLQSPQGFFWVCRNMSFKKLQLFRGLFDLFYGRNLYALMFCNFFNKPIIYESHASPSCGRKKLEEYLFNQSNFAGLVVINEALHDYYKENFKIFRDCPEKLMVCPDGGEEAIARVVGVAKNPGNHPTAGYAGSLYPGKGIEMIAKLAEARPGVNFVVAGGTAEQVGLMKQKWPFIDLQFKGFVKPSELASFYNECDILLAPYQQQVYSDDNEKRDLSKWMSPLKIFEYMGTGKAMIVSDLPCFNGILRDESNALLVRCDDTAKWLEAIDKLIANKDLCKSLSNKAYADLQSQYTWKARAERIIAGLYAKHIETSIASLQSGKPVILHIVGDLNVGGAERTMLNLLPLLNKGDYEHRILTLFEEGALADDFRKAGINVETLGFSKRFTAFLNPSNLIRLINTIKARKPRLIQTWMYHSNNLVNALHCFFKEIPVVNNIRHNDPNAGTLKTYASAVAGAMPAWMAPKAVVCCSEVAKKNHIAIGYPKDKMAVIPNGFVVKGLSKEEARKSCVEALAVPAENKLVIVAGRYCSEKDFPNFAAAACLILKNRSDVTFLLCGKGLEESNAELVKLLENNNAKDNCMLLGHRNNIETFMAAADLLVSASASEAFPNVIAEAMSVGTPCVGTDVGETRAIIGAAGLVVPAKNPQALADAVLSMLSNAEAYNDFASRTKAHIAVNYSLEATAKRYSELWQRITGFMRIEQGK